MNISFAISSKNAENCTNNFGGLAHLARALAWQARGDRFESGILHVKVPDSGTFFC